MKRGRAPPRWGAKIFRYARPVLARYWLVRRGLTFGVRGVVLDPQDRVLLVRHGYAPGWNFPGGGVEAGETAEEALRRELQEEAAVSVLAPPVLHGIFHQPNFSRRDHVAVFVVRAFGWDGPPPANWEIAECRFFPRDALPADISPGARRRLDEILDGAPASATW
jgi:ADP-ribose pyrophosphatase YjhB (NUDIX family)